MIYRLKLVALIVLLAVFPLNALALNSVVSGIFDGSEPTTAPLPGTCGGTEPLGYQEVGVFQVSESGNYTMTDPYNFLGVDISALVYENSFNPNNPGTNLVTPNGVDEAERVDLVAGVNYVLVVQVWCGNPDRIWVNRQGAWAVTYSGPGAVTSASKVTVPEWTAGVFASGNPTSNSQCGDSQYQQTGPIRVSTPGTYYYRDVSLEFDVDMCLQIYTAPFDPAEPYANRIFFEDDEGSVELQAGTDYYFVTQPLQNPTTGEFFYIFAPPAPFSITYAMAGSWYYPPTTGQGFLIDVFDTENLMFLAWFTYDLERPPADTPAMIGDPGHRWMTALGPFTGDTANLNITWSSGMIFDSETPPVENESDGTMTVEFNDCYTGSVSYDLGSSDRTGTVPIERIVNDAVPLCETLTEGPAKPGPL
ncbi:hypothetical protein ACFL07_12605 [Pseudomonadota bacterium]